MGIFISRQLFLHAQLAHLLFILGSINGVRNISLTGFEAFGVAGTALFVASWLPSVLALLPLWETSQEIAI